MLLLPAPREPYDCYTHTSRIYCSYCSRRASAASHFWAAWSLLCCPVVFDLPLDFDIMLLSCRLLPCHLLLLPVRMPARAAASSYASHELPPSLRAARPQPRPMKPPTPRSKHGTANTHQDPHSTGSREDCEQQKDNHRVLFCCVVSLPHSSRKSPPARERVRLFGWRVRP